MAIHAVVQKTMRITDPAIEHDERTPLCYSEALGHFFGAAILNTDGTAPEDLTGATVMANFIRGDSVSGTINGSISGGVAYVILPAWCYRAQGHFTLTVFLVKNNATRAIIIARGRTMLDMTETIIDPEHIVPSLAELLAQIQACRDATAAANSAARNANEKASAANTAAGNADAKAALADTAASDADAKAALANTAAENANAARDNANGAAAKINNMTVAASGLAAGASPTAQISEVSGHKHISFGIPQGAKGDTGSSGVYVGSTTPTDPDVNVWIDPTGEGFDVGELKSAISNIDNEVNASFALTWSRGTISTANGNPIDVYLETRIRSDYVQLNDNAGITVFSGAICFIFFYTSTNYLGYYNIPVGTKFDINAYVNTNYPSATRYRLLALYNPESTIGDGSNTDYNTLLEMVLISVIYKIKGDIADIHNNVAELDDHVFPIIATAWERGTIATSSGDSVDQYTSTRIRTSVFLSTNITIYKATNVTLVVYIYNNNDYVTYRIMSENTINIDDYISSEHIVANKIKLLLLFNPESTIGDGTETDYSSILRYLTIRISGTQYKSYVSGFSFFSVPINPASPITTGTENEVKDTDTSQNVTCMIKLPESYNPNGSPTKLLMICHGAGRGMVGSNNWTTQTGYNNIVNAFLAAGFAVFDCQGYADTEDGRSFWGAKKGVQAWRKAYEYIINNYNVEHEFVVYGFSMGGLTALGLAFDAYPNIKAIALASPVLDLSKCVSESTMRAAYGLSSATYDASACRGCNPMMHVFNFNGEDVIFSKLPPLKIWYGGNETNSSSQPYVEKTDAQKFVSAVMNGGGYAIYREVAGVGHEICYGLVPNAIAEYVMFLKRYQ